MWSAHPFHLGLILGEAESSVVISKLEKDVHHLLVMDRLQE
jgi:hypothetical protein